MSDLIARLGIIARAEMSNYAERTVNEAATALAEAEAEIARLRGALEPFAAVVKSMSQNHLNIEDSDEVYVSGKDLCRAYDVLAALSRPHATKGEAG